MLCKNPPGKRSLFFRYTRAHCFMEKPTVRQRGQYFSHPPPVRANASALCAVRAAGLHVEALQEMRGGEHGNLSLFGYLAFQNGLVGTNTLF